MQYGFVRRLSTLVRVGGVAALVLASAARVAASPLTYNEAVSGDLAWHASADAILNFDVGINTVSGHTFTDPNGQDWDSFAFAIPSGSQLTGISVTYASTWTPGTFHAELDYELHQGPVHTIPRLGFMTLDMMSGGPGAVFGGALPLSAGVYGIDWASAGYGGFDPVAFYSDYTWSFTVVGPASAPTVPEPASLVLFGTGLIVSVRKWRRKN